MKKVILIMGIVALAFNITSCSKYKEEKSLVRNKIETIDKNTKIDLKVNFENFEHYYDFTVEDSLHKSLAYFIKNTEISNATFENYIELTDSISDSLTKEHSLLREEYLKNKREIDKELKEANNMILGVELLFGEDWETRQLKRELKEYKKLADKELQKSLNKQSIILEKITQLDGYKSNLTKEYNNLSNKNSEDVLYEVYEVNYTWYSPELQTTKTKMTYYKIFEGTKDVVEANNYFKPDYKQYAVNKNGTILSEEQENDKMKNVSINSEDWDAVLISYESYINQYIKLMKKAQNGDMSVMTEYMSLMEKATDLGRKMEKAGKGLSPVQISKYMELQAKLLNAAADINKQ